MVFVQRGQNVEVETESVDGAGDGVAADAAVFEFEITELFWTASPRVLSTHPAGVR
jgi:hypothetical protein